MALAGFSNITDMKRQRVQTAFPSAINKQMEQVSMPATSKSQFKLMQGVAHGSINKPGPSKVEAKEYVAGQSPKDLPNKAPRRKIKFPKP
jgi:hypothetical protein